jgi:hypothetical protein
MNRRERKYFTSSQSCGDKILPRISSQAILSQCGYRINLYWKVTSFNYYWINLVSRKKKEGKENVAVVIKVV